MNNRVILEPEAEAVCEESAMPPRIYQLTPQQAREKLEMAQNSPVYMYPAKVYKMMYQTAHWGRIPVYVVSPENVSDNSDVIFYIHGAGWVMGSFHTHEKLVRELAARTGCILVFPEYARAPEAQYPIAIEQCYGTLCGLNYILSQSGHDIKGRKLIAAGDSVGGNMTIAMTLMSKYRKGPKIIKQLMYYPVTNACFNTKSYCKFATGYYLYRDGMKWFWNNYTCSEKDRNEITASPLRAEISQLQNLPPAMIINGQADVLRSEGEAFGEKLRMAGVSVTALRVQATIHDFVMLNTLNNTNACRTAMDASTEWIKNIRKKNRATVS